MFVHNCELQSLTDANLVSNVLLFEPSNCNLRNLDSNFSLLCSLERHQQRGTLFVDPIHSLFPLIQYFLLSCFVLATVAVMYQLKLQGFPQFVVYLD